MSLPDRFQPGSVVKRLLPLCVLGMALFASGCQVRPLYSDPGPVGSTAAGVSGSVRSRLATVSVNPAADRVTQEVRNNLIFLFGGGSGEPTHVAYTLQLGIISQNISLALIQNATNDKSGQPTAGSIRMTGNYVLTRASDGQVIGRGSRLVNAGYDAPRQQYAVQRAYRDAYNRAAAEVAQAIHLSVAQDLTKNQ
ncbi:MAG: LPS assembly lipoprotein LptE [Phyllobacterium sp.]|uniref:LPS assembly lipoprotein LptE n=1 Tax=Phyllobacterium sp. TaxID=1871046 RepID=UPI0030F311D3